MTDPTQLAAMNTPQDILKSAHLFCNLIASARKYKHPKAWSGSAHCHHPCGIIEGTIKLTNDWTTWDGCSIEITNGDGWSLDFCRDSWSRGGNPNPQPINGKAVSVWQSGKWLNETFRDKMEVRCIEIIGSLIEFVTNAKDEERRKHEAKQEEIRQRRAQIEQEALAKL